jgi:tartrate-resistant acid phosphatase type 5
MTAASLSRRAFLRQTVAFSAMAATSGLARAVAPAIDPKAAHILIIGDWGYTKPEGQRQVAEGMAAYTKQNSLKPEALFMLGDSWYGALPGGPDSPRWQTQFEQMYPATLFPGPAYSIMGNHDYQRIPIGVSKVQAELDYAKRGRSRWTQPGLRYTFDFTPTGHKDPLLHVIALDSNAPGSRGIDMLDPINFTLTAAEWQEQLTWLDAELAKPTHAPFRIVMGHHPIFSNGRHGDTAALVRDWNPRFHARNVHAYLFGHDHDLQHLEFAGHPTSFVGSGAGGADLYEIRIPESQRGPFADRVYGFTHLEATPTKLTFRHIDAQGNVLHAFSKSRNGAVTLL